MTYFRRQLCTNMLPLFQMCYGIIYGMGSKTLSEQLHVEETTAEQLMTQFQFTFTGQYVQ